MGVKQDHARARELFTDAAAQGYGPAMVNLGRMYAAGSGGKQDAVGGYALIRAALATGIPDSMSDIAIGELRNISNQLRDEQLARGKALSEELSAAIEARNSSGAVAPEPSAPLVWE
jgi:TPR repeat protein